MRRLAGTGQPAGTAAVVAATPRARCDRQVEVRVGTGTASFARPVGVGPRAQRTTPDTQSANRPGSPDQMPSASAAIRVPSTRFVIFWSATPRA
ncbi:MAG: hypothetical protein AVDCRST_MAG73-1133 [uncultured Thermomicrobiales bacterium]|uniref:Uncharacterized protein n=1 Tax=uncultured Thermomicrobiales bacterium TaxID=1645740 RepID=A0A6J4TW21_9BACT|nr:MAG: hypothetical protein AVDCRST_MAG73-1133 [uncultured Thermomicrobiales bacterium]